MVMRTYRARRTVRAWRHHTSFTAVVLFIFTFARLIRSKINRHSRSTTPNTPFSSSMTIHVFEYLCFRLTPPRNIVKREGFRAAVPPLFVFKLRFIYQRGNGSSSLYIFCGLKTMNRSLDASVCLRINSNLFQAVRQSDVFSLLVAPIFARTRD